MNNDSTLPSIKKSLSTRLSLIVVSSALIIGAVLSFVQIYLDLQEQKKLINSNLNRVIQSVTPAAEIAVYEVDKQFALQLAKGVLGNKSIAGVIIKDHLAGELANLSEPIESSSYQWLIKKLFEGSTTNVVELRDVNDSSIVNGELILKIDPSQDAVAFIKRAVIQLISGIATSCILALVCLGLFFHYLSLPIRRITGEIVAQNEQKSPYQGIALPNEHIDNEIGLLIKTFNQMSEKLIKSNNESLQFNEVLKEKVKLEQSISQLKDEFLATISHELRTPINGIKGSLEVINEYPLEPEARHFTNTAILATEQLNHMVNDMLAYAELQSGTLRIAPKPTNIGKIVKGFVSGYKDIRKAGVIFTIDIDKEFPRYLMLDGGRLQMVLLHILKNSYQHTKYGEIKTKMRYLKNDKVLSIVIEDTGSGIREADQEKIWQAFRQVDNSYQRKTQGLGLGLSLCSALLNAMNGEINLKSELGKGTTVYITVPTNEISQTKILIEKEKRVFENVNHEKSALIVEDNPINLTITDRILSKSGFKTFTATDGMQAIELLEKESPEIDLILMDCQMPVMDGFEATKHIRSLNKYAKVPIIAVTANSRVSERERCFDVGMNDHISKPVSSRYLKKIITKWL